MRIVLLGGSGNIGSAVVGALTATATDTDTDTDTDLATDLVVDLVSRRPGAAAALAAAAGPRGAGGPRLRDHPLDLADPRSDGPLTALLAGADAVVHLAWLIQPSHRPAAMAAVNVAGSRRVLAAVAAAGVPTLVVASSVGAYSPRPAGTAGSARVGEAWPVQGIRTSVYARHKAGLEADLDAFAAEHPATRLVRLRPAVVLQQQAGAEQGRYFLGRWVPKALLRPDLLPALPVPAGLQLQVVHADDVAAAVVAALRSDVAGAFNLAAEPVLDAAGVAAALGTRPLPIPAAVLRAVLTLSWRARLQPTDPGWLDLALQAPLMDTTRARTLLGWRPAHSADQTLAAGVRGVRRRDGAGTPPLRRHAAPLAR